MAKARPQLAAKAFFWRVYVFAFVVIEFSIVAGVMRRARPPRVQVARFLGSIPLGIVSSIAVASVVTVLAAVIVHLIVRPAVMRWHEPPSDADMGQFHLAASERIVASSPARRSEARGWPPGTLIVTNLRLWFVPHDHLFEVWSCPLDRLGGIRVESPAAVARGLIRDWPARVAVPGVAGSDPVLFAVADADAVISWFRPRAAVPSRS